MAVYRPGSPTNSTGLGGGVTVGIGTSPVGASGFTTTFTPARPTGGGGMPYAPPTSQITAGMQTAGRPLGGISLGNPVYNGTQPPRPSAGGNHNGLPSGGIPSGGIPSGGIPSGGMQGLVPGAYQQQGSNGQMQVDTSITPRPIYTPGMTTGLLNQTQGQAEVDANPAFLKKGLDGRGVSRSVGSDAAVAPQQMSILGQAATANAAVPFADSFSNAANMLSGEAARDAEALGLAGIGAGMWDSSTGAGNQQQQLLMSLLAGLL